MLQIFFTSNNEEEKFRLNVKYFKLCFRWENISG